MSGTTVTQDGTVIDGRQITGLLAIEADNVIVRNSKVTGSSNYDIHVRGSAQNVLIENVEINSAEKPSIGIHFSQGSSGTVRRANIWNGEDGIRVQGNNITIEDSYLHDLFRYPGGHHDTIQIRQGDNITIRRNTLMAYKPSTDDPMNASIQIGSLVDTSNQIDNLRVLNNYMDGGSYTVNGGGRGEVASAVYDGNRFGRHFRYGVRGNMQNSTWTNNVYDDNGQPAS